MPFTACLGGLIERNYFIDLDYLIWPNPSL